jgi:multidrug efflux pump subunit AcrA (membrane-fusion protein)
VEYRVITPGSLQHDGLRVIQAGLKSGEWIIVNGLQRARPGVTVEPQRAEMPTQMAERK